MTDLRNLLMRRDGLSQRMQDRIPGAAIFAVVCIGGRA